MLKILLLNYTDSGGGAAIAAHRLLTALRGGGIDATLGVVEKHTADKAVISLAKKKSPWRGIMKISKKLITLSAKMLKLRYKTTNPIFHSTNTKTRIDINAVNNSDYDLVHLHWLNCDMIAIEDLARIKKPLVWTMHDSWVFCGAEHHPNILENDRRFITGYTRANKPATTRGIDVCRKTWERKKQAWKNCKFNFISPSNFEKDCLAQSALFPYAECAVIPNIIPSAIFRPIDRKSVRDLYQITTGKKVIGFGAADASGDKNKNGDALIKALQKISNPDDFQLVVFGRASAAFIAAVGGMAVFATGFIENPSILAGIYNLLDVFVCPSVIENLSNCMIEAMFCGVPVAAFRTGGNSDIVEHEKNGYLAEPFDSDDLHRGIRYCLDNRAELSRRSLAKAAADFDNADIVKAHVALYEKVLRR
ncbi:MAG: glycosyltransferase [Planctomycetota bacterium]|jgi:glycosyltransferase involved in cell wall biosynthesis|nr:glycosyltransferase [Planctomycetota bacterium]